MQTTIKRKLQPSQMLQLFDSNLINIRWYEIDENSIFGSNEKSYYKITIRHSEEEKAAEVYKKAIQKIKN